MTPGVASAYQQSAASWVRGPEGVYDRLAEALVASCPLDLGGRRVLDLGAGSGSVSRAARRVGAHPVVVDAAPAMLATAGCTAFPAVVADGGRLPLRGRSVAAVLAGFFLTHCDDPTAMLAEAARVTMSGGVVLATTFDRGAPEHPGKAAVDRVAEAHGWVMPRWYAHFKGTTELRLSTPQGLLAVAGDPALVARVERRSVDIGTSSAREIVAWRLGMAHLAPWVAGLPVGDRRSLEEEACRAVGARPEPVHLAILVLVARVSR
jgi:SAM-dependent methyltransferase